MKSFSTLLILIVSSLYSTITFDKILEGYAISKIFESTGNNDGYTIIGSKNGNAIFLKLDEYGDIIYEKEYDFENEVLFSVTSIKCDAEEDNIITIGHKDFNDGSKDILIIKYNSEGDTLWTRSIDHNIIDYPSDILEIPNENEFLMSFFHAEDLYSDDYDPILTRLNNVGQTIWQKEYDSEYRDNGFKIVEATGNNYFLSLTRGDFMGHYGEILKVDSEGDTLFTKKIVTDFTVILRDHIKEINNGDYIISGAYGISQGVGFSYHELYVVKHDELGNLIWEFLFGNGEEYSAYGMTVISTNDFGCLVGGYTNAIWSAGIVGEAVIVKLDEDGNEEWNKLFPIDNVETYVTKLLQTSDGGYICGFYNNNNTARIIKLDENGNVGIDNNNYELAITDYELNQNYPNPFNPVTKIRYQLSASSKQLAEIVVYNSAGQQVWSQNLSTDHSSPITDHCLFDGSKFNSGIYFYSLVIDDKKVDTKSMILLK